ncbi:MAG TPA: hypothetical protein VJS64_15265 [Pyrinomonadaceae bacterium]|nr:hypothetical protein [Pyrinomonadaceae bacterium]
MPSNPVSLLVMIVLAAFVIDRLVAGLLFLVSFSPAWNKHFPDGASIEDAFIRRGVEKKQKLIYFILASFLALVFLLSFKQVGVLKALGFQNVNDTSATTTTATTGATTPDPAAPVSDPNKRTVGDFLLTWLILVGGAENIARLLKSQGEFGGGSQKESQPIEITGKLTLEDRSGKNT